MGRRAAKLQLMADKTARQVTFNIRKAGFLKKLKEFKTLCAVDICAVIHSNYDAKPEFWPSKSEVCHVMYKFEGSMKQAENNVDQETFLKKRIAKVQVDLKKENMKNQRLRVLSLVDKYTKKPKNMDGIDVGKIEDIKNVLDDVNQVSNDIEMAISCFQVESGDGPYLFDLNKEPASTSEDG